MNKIVNKFLFAEDKYMPKLSKHRESIRKLKQTGDLNYIYKNELDKVCFSHDATYSDSKNLAKRTISSTILNYSDYEIAVNTKYDGYQRGLASMVYKFFDKKKKQDREQITFDRPFHQICLS